jgi:hypothetical protein
MREMLLEERSGSDEVKRKYFIYKTFYNDLIF